MRSEIITKIKIFLAILCVLISPLSSLAEEVSLDKMSKWTLVWEDEFEGKKLNMDKWSYETDCWGGGNEERQCYTARKKNVRVEDGVLKIIARKERFTGRALPPRLWTLRKDSRKAASKRYTSGRIRTIGKGDWRYGRVEVRAKLPGGQGIWPAIWMLPTDEYYGAWAASGEIDIMEAINLGVKCEECEGGTENRVHGTLHYGGKWPLNKHSGTETVLPGAIDEFYTYAIEWNAGKISWFVNDTLYAVQTQDDWYFDGEKAEDRPFAPFDQRFHIILNLAVGGNWPEQHNEKGLSRKNFPKTMEVDWVRVYECDDGPETGLACRK